MGELGAVSQQNTGEKRSCGSEEPLDAPNLNGLPVQNRVGAENEADQNSSNGASCPYQERNKGDRREADALFDMVELKVSRPRGRSGRDRHPFARYAAHVAESRAHDELAPAALASFSHAGGRGSRMSQGSLPELAIRALNYIAHCWSSPCLISGQADSQII